MSQLNVVLGLSRRLIDLNKRFRYQMDCFHAYQMDEDKTNQKNSLECLKALRREIAGVLICLHIATDGAYDDCLQNLATSGGLLKPYE